MNLWKVILATMVIFGTGVVTGGLILREAPRLRAARAARTPPPGRPALALTQGGLRFDFLRRMERELDLSPEQHARIERIFGQSQERTRRIIEPVKPQLMEELKRTRLQFREVLTPSQQARFEQLLHQQQQRQHDMRRGQPARDHPPGAPPVSTNAPAKVDPP